MRGDTCFMERAQKEGGGEGCRGHQAAIFLFFFVVVFLVYPVDMPECLQNGCVMRLVCWWAFGCSSPCAFNPHRWLASCSQHRERESRVSVFPCQYIAYPQQVLCSAFSRLQVSMGAARPQNRTARAKLAWPNGGAGRGGQKSQRLRKQTRSSLAIGWIAQPQWQIRWKRRTCNSQQLWRRKRETPCCRS